MEFVAQVALMVPVCDMGAFCVVLEGLQCLRRGSRKDVSGVSTVAGTTDRMAVSAVVICGSVFMLRTFLMAGSGPGGRP